MIDMRQVIGEHCRRLVGSGSVDLSRPAGDPGLFGPGSPAWAIHGDFSAMMIGGVSALLLQMLHPLALAGVWDHSNWQEDRVGRLRGTARFLSVTTFGSTANAEAAIARVRRIHDHITGTLPDGTPYAASDPALLAWVHAAEADSFLRAHLRYRDPAMPGRRQDRYLAETAAVARRLGAAGVPESRRALADYFARVRPELRADARTRSVAAALIEQQDGGWAGGAGAVIVEAAIDLLPRWAARLHGFDRPVLSRPAVRLGAHGVGRVLRWALARPPAPAAA